MKQVVNCSKDYAVAFVPVDVSYEAYRRAVFATLKEAGLRLKVESGDVPEPTESTALRRSARHRSRCARVRA